MDGQGRRRRQRGGGFVGKLKTAAQMSAIPLLLYQAPVLGLTGWPWELC
jgi:phosphatidylglycerophosphate synthase